MWCCKSSDTSERELPRTLLEDKISVKLVQGFSRVLDHGAANKGYKHNRMKIEYLLNPQCGDTSGWVKGSTLEYPTSIEKFSETETTSCESRELSPSSTSCQSKLKNLNWLRSSVSGSPVSGIQTSRGTTPDSDPVDEGAVPARDFRRPYTYEQQCWILFHTTDVPIPRSSLVDEYNRQFPGLKRTLDGLQSWLYRSPRIMGHNDPRRGQKRNSKRGHIDAAKYGAWALTGHKFPWMDEWADKLPGYTIGGPYYQGEP